MYYLLAHSNCHYRVDFMQCMPDGLPDGRCWCGPLLLMPLLLLLFPLPPHTKQPWTENVLVLVQRKQCWSAWVNAGKESKERNRVSTSTATATANMPKLTLLSSESLSGLVWSTIRWGLSPFKEALQHCSPWLCHSISANYHPFV